MFWPHPKMSGELISGTAPSPDRPVIAIEKVHSTHKRFLYSYSNPLNYSDPSGLRSSDCPNPNECKVDSDDRDLTDWLVRAMNANADSPEIAEINRLNEDAAKYYRAGVVFPPIVGFTCPAEAVSKYQAYTKFYDLVRRHARWDFKDKIESFLGKNIRLCDTYACRWYFFDVVANIHFGYIGRAAGFLGIELHGGAGIAQTRDDPGTANCWYLCDDPLDFQAVDFGISLFNTSSGSLDIERFAEGLSIYSWLKPGMRPSKPYWNQVYGTNYPIDFFNDGSQ